MRNTQFSNVKENCLFLISEILDYNYSFTANLTLFSLFSVVLTCKDKDGVVRQVKGYS